VWRDDSAVFVLFGDYVQQSLSPQRCTQTQTHPHTHTRTTSPTLRKHKDLPKKKRKQRNIEFKKVPQFREQEATEKMERIEKT